MKPKGYNWSSSEKNYVLIPQEKTVSTSTHSSPEIPIKEEGQELMRTNEINTIFNRKNDGGCECLDRYGAILKLLEEKKDRLAELLNEEANKGEITRYILHGDAKTKSLKINETLDNLIYDFSEERNISQKDIIQTALVEFFRKYGYKQELRASLKI
ncbi:MAG: hypothetical protein ACM3TR_11625 [Caulobacteraceae bacterium]